MCCCWLWWWWYGRSRWSFCCVEGALWRLLWLRQRKASWKLPPNSKLKSRSDTHPHLAKLHNQTEAWEQLTSGKARIYSVLKISRLQYLLFTDHLPCNFMTWVSSFRSQMKTVNSPWLLWGSTCCLWLPKASLWVLPLPWETLPSSTFSSTRMYLVFQSFFATYAQYTADCNPLLSGMLVNIFFMLVDICLQ